jgi:hypothetical protein
MACSLNAILMLPSHVLLVVQVATFPGVSPPDICMIFFSPYVLHVQPIVLVTFILPLLIALGYLYKSQSVSQHFLLASSP